MKLLGLVWKLLRALVHAVCGFWTIKTVFHKLEQVEQEARVHAWAAHMLRIVDIRLEVLGTPPAAGPMLLVANHISWLDILVMHAARHCRFVSKSDVKGWPFVRTLADGAGTLYLERESRRDAHRVVVQMAERLRAGDILAVFPEGTTGDGITLKPFHANLIQAAIEASVPVQPVALKFIDAATGATSFAPSYVDDETLMGSIWRTLTAHGLKAVVTFGAPQESQGKNRREWSHALRKEIEHLRRM
ncbi:lysophospholipid acyltransferase family protein [Polaromonas jejuensis]|uniref:Lysophospholipid acyltransferase family protein n=1 Tax=Polaromonas jejuensis TaxID=457502 RepID=A0ABW0QCH0_9BURK|nr:lysophospholipid acyltransferase family protein [Polaromonas jejuensis]